MDAARVDRIGLLRPLDPGEQVLVVVRRPAGALGLPAHDDVLVGELDPLGGLDREAGDVVLVAVHAVERDDEAERFFSGSFSGARMR